MAHNDMRSGGALFNKLHAEKEAAARQRGLQDCSGTIIWVPRWRSANGTTHAARNGASCLANVSRTQRPRQPLGDSDVEGDWERFVGPLSGAPLTGRSTPSLRTSLRKGKHLQCA